VIDTSVLDERGFTTVPLLGATELADLRTAVEGLDIDPSDPYFVSSVHGSRDLSRAVDAELKRRLAPRLAELMPGYEPFMAAVISKGAGGGRVGLHPDWTYADERRHRTRLFWMPLDDTSEANGAMVTVPSSHRSLCGLRGSGAFPSPVEHIEDDLWAGHVETVPLVAGEAVVWDAALLHGSWPNTSTSPRPAAVIALAPADATLVHFHIDPGGRLAGRTVDEAWFTADPYGTLPEGYPALEPWDGPVQPFASVEAVVTALQPGDGHR
jgi:hypothetical protein